MPDPEKRPRYKVGDTVRIHVLPSKLVGTVTEVTYVPAGSGRISYRIRVVAVHSTKGVFPWLASFPNNRVWT